MDYSFDMKKTQLRILENQTTVRSFHRDTTLFYVLSGNFRLEYSGRSVKLHENDVIVVNSGETYRFTVSEGALILEITIAYELIRENGRLTFICNSVNDNTEVYSELRLLLKKLMFRYLQRENMSGNISASFGYLSEYFHLVEELASCFSIRRTYDKNTAKHDDEWRHEEIEQYIYDSFAEPVNLKDLADHLALSESHLSKWIRQNYGVPFNQLLRSVRLTKAAEDLAYTDRSITRIATDCGFLNISYFTKVFKEEFGKSPSDYRKEYGPSDQRFIYGESSKQKMENYLRNNPQLRKEMQSAFENTYELRRTDQLRINSIWNQILNVGRASLLLHHNMQEQIRQLVRDLGFRYVRFWSLLSRDMLASFEGGTVNINFRKINQVIDFVLSTGAKPFIDFEEKPLRINRTAFSQMILESNDIELESEAQLQEIMTVLTRHWLSRYGATELSEWIIEVWFDSISIKGYDEYLNYFTLFRITYDTFKKQVPGISIGGSGIIPGYVTEESDCRIRFIKQWKVSAPVPDFISLMNFTYEADESRFGFSRRSMDSHYLNHSTRILRRELAEDGWEKIPLYITEWNLTVSDRNYLNDSCFQAAYIVSNMIETCDKLDMVGYFNASDLICEYYDSGELLFGGSGLVNMAGIFKPAAYAIQFLNMLYPYCCGRSEWFLATENRQGSYAIICHNMKQLNYFYYSTEENEIDKSLVWKCFDDTSVLHLGFILKDVGEKTYCVKIYRVNEAHGSILDIWKQMDYYSNIMENELSHIRRSCLPLLTRKFKNPENGELRIEIVLEANEIALIQIEGGEEWQNA